MKKLFVFFLIIGLVFGSLYFFKDDERIKPILEKINSLSAGRTQNEKMTFEEKKSDTAYVVRKDGSIIQGALLEKREDLVKIQDNDGNIHLIRQTEIEKLFIETPEDRKMSVSSSQSQKAATKRKAEKIKTISHGESVDLQKHLIKGYVTVVDFYADWCGPCRQLGPHLESLVKQHDDVILRKVDIKTWGTPVTKQYKITFVPNVRVYDKRGRMVGKPTSDFSLISQYVNQSR